MIKMSCDEANHTCDKTQYKEASLLEKIKLNWHLLWCRACRKYTANNQKLTKAFRKPTPQFSPTQKTVLQERINRELKN